MITRTFIDKTNTIVNSSDENFGLNPICSLNYGKRISRILVYFNVDSIVDKVNDGTFKNIENLSHHLRMTNCGTADPKKFMERDEAYEYLSQCRRASSFDVIAFRVPQPWDAGDGFDNSTDEWFLGYKSVSKNGSTWEKAMNGVHWQETEKSFTPGIYTPEFLSHEYEKWGRGEESVVIGRQHFDYGNENLDIDITEFVNDILSGTAKNYGLCLAFSPRLEESTDPNENYINFFGPHTNTFFAPYVETKYDIKVNDDRYKFYAGKKNRLYFYSVVGGKFVDLDEMPTCTIDDTEYEVKSDTKGIYYIEVKLPANTKTNTIKYDTWSNIVLDGEAVDDVEMEFVVLSAKNFFSFNDEIADNANISPVLYGINDAQKTNQGEKREIRVVFRVPYSSADYELLDESYYRIYTKDGKREIDVIDWEPIITLGKDNLFELNTSEFLPQEYWMDIKAVSGRQTLLFKNVLNFTIVDNSTEINR